MFDSSFNRKPFSNAPFWTQGNNSDDMSLWTSRLDRSNEEGMLLCLGLISTLIPKYLFSGRNLAQEAIFINNGQIV